MINFIKIIVNNYNYNFFSIISKSNNKYKSYNQKSINIIFYISTYCNSIPLGKLFILLLRKSLYKLI